MDTVRLVAQREFGYRIRTRGFLFATLGLPLLMLVIWWASSLLAGDTATPSLSGGEGREPERAPVGYVDQARLIRQVPPDLPAGLLLPFPDEESARRALLAAGDDGPLVAYYVISPDYRETGRVERVSRLLPTVPPDTELLDRLLVANLLPDASAARRERLRAPLRADPPILLALDEAGEQAADYPMLPLVVAMVIMAPLFMSGGYLLYGLAEEKSSRIMELLLASLSPRQLLAGKLLGLGAVTLVQYLAWVLLGLAGMALTGRDPATALPAMSLGPYELGLAGVYSLGGYWLYAGLMAGIGALSSDLESSRSWVFVITLPMLIPIYLWTAIVGDPQGPVAVALSLIPFSAPLTMLMRLTVTGVPPWQIGLSLILLLVTAAAVLWLMARLFRVQTLLSGQSFSPARAWAALRHG